MAPIIDEMQKEMTEFYDESPEFRGKNVEGAHAPRLLYAPGVQPSLAERSAWSTRPSASQASQMNLQKRPKRAVDDVGCGIGGASFYIAKKYGAECHGINISSVQVQRAQALAISEGLADKVFFQVGDALEQPFPDNHFDLVWSMECAEHIPNKKKAEKPNSKPNSRPVIRPIISCLKPDNRRIRPANRQIQYRCGESVGLET